MNDSKAKNSEVFAKRVLKAVCEPKTSSISSLNALELWHDLVRKNGFLLKVVEKSSSKIAQGNRFLCLAKVYVAKHSEHLVEFLSSSFFEIFTVFMTSLSDKVTSSDLSDKKSTSQHFSNPGF